jgi:hypothetical protein
LIDLRHLTTFQLLGIQERSKWNDRQWYI